jgi:hypothetical protein
VYSELLTVLFNKPSTNSCVAIFHFTASGFGMSIAVVSHSVVGWLAALKIWGSRLCQKKKNNNTYALN